MTSSDTLSGKTILLLGDSIRMGYAPFVRDMLKDRATVLYPDDNCRFAQYLFRGLYDWRALPEDAGAVDIVHWNSGLWDIGQMDASDCVTPPDIYIRFQERICDTLRRYFPNAALAFATTTPINTSVVCEQHTLGNAVVEEYNALARAVLEPRGVAIDDLYSFVRQNATQHYADIVHYTPEGFSLIAEEVVRFLERTTQETRP